MARAQENLAAQEARAIEQDFLRLLASGRSYWRRCSDHARYSDPAIIEAKVEKGIARLKVRVSVTNLSADPGRDPKLADCFGGQYPAPGARVDIVLLATYRKTGAGWKFD